MEYLRASLRPLVAALGQQLERAASAVVRLDEQILRLGRVGEGYRTRTDFQEACALRAIAGELVPIDDLVLVEPVHRFASRRSSSPAHESSCRPVAPLQLTRRRGPGAMRPCSTIASMSPETNS
jgi:hypothetical protein